MKKRLRKIITFKRWLFFAKRFVGAGILLFLFLMVMQQRKAATYVITVVLVVYLVGAFLFSRCPKCETMFRIRTPSSMDRCPLCGEKLD